MTNIPSHFHKQFKSISQLDEHFNLSIAELSLTQEEKNHLVSLCNKTLVATLHREQDIYSKWSERNIKEPLVDLNKVMAHVFVVKPGH
jgi:hypothetical protein